MEGVILVGIVAGFLGVRALSWRDRVPEWITFRGPLLSVKTTRGERLLRRLAVYRRFWRLLTTVGTIVSVAAMLASIGLLVWIISTTTTAPGSLQNTVFSPQVSMSALFVLAIIGSLVVHELGHGILCFVEDIDVDAVGVTFVLLAPLTAYVEQDGDSRDAAPYAARMRMFAAGITNNLVLGLLAFALLAGPVSGSLAAAPGAHVGSTVTGSPADAAGIERGEVITAVNGTPVTDSSGFDDALDSTGNPRVTLADGETVTVERYLVVTSTATDLPSAFDSGNPPPQANNATQITAVDGTPVRTVQDFRDAVDGRQVVRLETPRGPAQLRLGAYVRTIEPTGPLTAAGLSTDDAPLLITHADGTQITSASEFRQRLRDAAPGESVRIRIRDAGESRTITVTPDEGKSLDARLGVELAPGFGGLGVDDIGVRPVRTETVLAGLHDGGTIDRLRAVVIAPIASLISTERTHSVTGLTGATSTFYVVNGPLEALGPLALPVAALVFWSAWINLVFGLTNAVPALPADGGHLLRAGTGAVVARVGVSNVRSVQALVTLVVTLVFWVALVAGLGLFIGL